MATDIPLKSGPTRVRLNEIDGIRGWAALSVMLYHFFIEMYVKVWPEVDGFVPRMLMHGPLAVSVFFVLSGDALFSASSNGGLRALDSMVIKRYWRLTIPIFMSCLLVYMIMIAGLTFNVQAGDVLNHKGWLGNCVAFEAKVMTLIHYSFYGVYTSQGSRISYNPFLWTMSIELIGSMLVFLYSYTSDRLKRPAMTLFALAVLFYLVRSFCALFFVGALFSLLRKRGHFDRMRASASHGAVALALACLAVDAWCMSTGHLSAYLQMPLGAILVFALYSCKPLLNFFSSNFSLFLGRISFSLYLVHFSIMVSLASWLVLYFNRDLELNHRVMLGIATVASITSVALSVVFWQIESRVVTALNVLPRAIFKKA